MIGSGFVFSGSVSVFRVDVLGFFLFCLVCLCFLGYCSVLFWVSAVLCIDFLSGLLHFLVFGLLHFLLAAHFLVAALCAFFLSVAAFSGFWIAAFLIAAHFLVATYCDFFLRVAAFSGCYILSFLPAFSSCIL